MMRTFLLSIVLFLISTKSSNLLPPESLNNFLLPPTSQPSFELQIPTSQPYIQPYIFDEKSEILNLKLKILELEMKMEMLKMLFELHENQHQANPKFTIEKSMKI